MVGILSLLIFFFTLFSYITSQFLHMTFFTSDTAVFIIAMLPIVGIIFAIWSHGLMKFIGIIGNLAVIIVATLLPIFFFYF